MPVNLIHEVPYSRHLHHVVIYNTKLDPIRHSQPGPILQQTTRSVMPNSVSTHQSGTKTVRGICTALKHSTGQTPPRELHTSPRHCLPNRERLPYAGGALTRDFQHSLLSASVLVLYRRLMCSVDTREITPVADTNAAMILVPIAAPDIVAGTSLQPRDAAQAAKELRAREQIQLDIPGARVSESEVSAS